MKSIEDYGFVDFETIKEGWSEYVLEDGTIIRTKAILLKVVRISNTEFTFIERSFAVSFSPKEAKGPAGTLITSDEVEKVVKSVKKEDLKTLISKPRWAEYELSSGEKFSTRAELVSSSLTDRYDENGDPIYGVQLTVIHKLIPKKDDKKAT